MLKEILILVIMAYTPYDTMYPNLTFGGFGNDWQKLEGKIKNTVYLGAWTSPYRTNVTGCTTGSKQDQSKGLE
jgi:hypothetical protein